MSYAKQLLDTYPRSFNVDAGVLAKTIDAVSDCAQVCTACADDCLSEQNVAELVKCIRLCLDCADVCAATLGVASRQTEYDANVTRPLLGLRGRLPQLRRRVPAARRDARALPGLRRGVPTLRAGLPRAAGRDALEGSVRVVLLPWAQEQSWELAPAARAGVGPAGHPTTAAHG